MATFPALESWTRMTFEIKSPSIRDSNRLHAIPHVPHNGFGDSSNGYITMAGALHTMLKRDPNDLDRLVRRIAQMLDIACHAFWLASLTDAASVPN